MASLAQSTGTLIESGCKHIIPVRVSMETMMQLVDEDPHTRMRGEIFQRDKYKYSANKDDLLLCVEGAMFPQFATTPIVGKQAYPPVVSNLGDIPMLMKFIICGIYEGSNDMIKLIYHDRNTGGDNVNEMKTHLTKRLTEYLKDKWSYNETGKINECIEKMKNFPLLRFMGFSCGLGYVHPNCGDTVVSSYVGGMTTVRNGAFPIKAGDLVMWYFDFEQGMFDENGKRLETGINLDNGYKQNPRYNNMQAQNGWLQKPGVPVNVSLSESGQGMRGAKQNIFLPKPYIRTKRCNPMDVTRVFARALGNARPFDMVDLKICTIPVV